MQLPGRPPDPVNERTEARTLALTASVALSLSSIGMFLATAGRVAPGVAIGTGALLSFLCVCGLTSIGPVRGAFWAQAIGLFALIRLLAVPGADATWVLPWAVGLVATLVLINGVGAKEPGLPGAGRQRWARRSLRAMALVSVVVLAMVLLFGPAVSDRIRNSGTNPGESPTLRSTNPSLLASDSLDTTNRPGNSDQIVFTVKTKVPSFWRGEVYDVWDGRRWTRSNPGGFQRLNGTTVLPGADDIGARVGVPLSQTFRLVASASTIIFGAPSPIDVAAPVPVVQRPDGTLASSVMGTGATYTVISNRVLSTRESLQAETGDIPQSVLDQYAAPPTATDRTVALAKRVTAGKTTTFDKIEALEDYLGSTTTYSIKAPLAPKDKDVVDDFLFNSKQGWCEQIASSLVVLLRSIGVPARLATGYVPEGRNPLTNTYTVRGRDAHAWTEVWFPESGWQSFDPTAHVPFAGDADTSSTLTWLTSHLVQIGIALGAALALWFVVRFLRRLRPARAARLGWAGATLRRMERLGAEAHRPRRPHETATAYGGALAEALGADGLAEVGRLVDDDRYRPDPLDEPARRHADAVLASAERR